MSSLLSQSKVQLIISVVRCMGIEKALELFNQTSEIQVNGGQVSVEGTYKLVGTSLTHKPRPLPIRVAHILTHGLFYCSLQEVTRRGVPGTC